MEEIEKEFVTGRELAILIAKEITDSNTIFKGKLWEKKAGETRVYVSYPGRNKPTECGYIRIMDSGSIYGHLTLQPKEIEEIYSPLLERYTVVVSKTFANFANKAAATPASAPIVEECWECGATYTTHGNVEVGNMGCIRCR